MSPYTELEAAKGGGLVNLSLSPRLEASFNLGYYAANLNELATRKDKFIQDRSFF